MVKTANLLKGFLIFQIIAFHFLFYNFAGAQDWERSARDAEQSLVQRNKAEAERNFHTTRDVALSVGSWEGLVRAGNGFAVLGKNKEAIKSLAYARDLSWKSATWEGAAAAGYAFIALEDMKQAIQSCAIARDISWKQRSWYGLVSSGKGFAMLGDYKEAFNCVRIARDISWKQRSWYGLVSSGKGFAMLEDYKEAFNCFRIAGEISREQRSWEGLIKTGQGFALIKNQSEAEGLYQEAENVASRQGSDASESLGRRIKFFTDTLLIVKMRNLQPGLARNWEVNSRDKSTIFHLRERLTFFNGRNFNADSVTATFRENQESWKRLGIQSVEYVDEYRVKIFPFNFLFSLTDQTTSIEYYRNQ